MLPMILGMMGLSAAMAPFTGQNFGAKKTALLHAAASANFIAGGIGTLWLRFALREQMSRQVPAQEPAKQPA